MANDLDYLLARLATAAPDRRLDALEPLVWARVAELQDGALSSRWRAGIVAAALAIGVAVGVAPTTASPAADPLTVFSAEARLAPSTLLAGRR